MIQKPSNKIKLANKELIKTWNTLKSENSNLIKFLEQAKQNLKENAFCGIQIPKKLIPKILIRKHQISNLWKYNLPNAWRLLYTITTPNEIEIITVVLDWMPHRRYEKLFKY